MKKDLLELLGYKNIKELKKGVIEEEKNAVEFYEFIKEYLKIDTKEDLILIKGKNELVDYLKVNMGFLKHEEFKIILLSANNRLIYEESLFKGTIDRSVVYPRLIIERVLKYQAKGIIFAHNHPSGDLKPSKKDIEITLEMQEILDKVDIKLLDHVIVSDSNYFSFYENGLIEYF